MKLIRKIGWPTLSIALLCALPLGVAWFTTRSASAAPNAGSALSEPGNATIENAMKQMSAALKAMGKGVTAETRQAALVEIARFQAALIEAKAATPESAAKVDEKKRAAFANDYRKSLIEALKVACDAEIAIVDGKYKDADSLIHNKLEGLKSAGHSKFKGDAGK